MKRQRKPMDAPLKRACLLALAIALTAAACLLYILLKPPAAAGANLVAMVYQDGELLREIPLSEVTQSYTFTVVSKNGGTNEVEVRPDGIGIRAADCPDRICVKQGFIRSSLLPITCLPNRLVIQIREEEPDGSETEQPDGVAY